MVKIFIIDDEKSICETLAWTLGQEGYEVTWEIDFDTAREIIEGSDFDIYIVDIFFPGRNGMDLIRLIKTLEKSGIILVMSGYPNVPILIESIRLDAYDFIKKPFNHDYLKEVIDHILSVEDDLVGFEYRKAFC